MKKSAEVNAEEARLNALRNLLISTAPEERYDRIVQHAVEAFSVPMACISLVEAEHQWFKSRVGIEISYSTRYVSICNYTIQQNRVLVIPDTLKDERTRTSSLVLASPFIRFYAGAPLRIGTGEIVGTFSLWDTEPRVWDESKNARLEKYRNLVVVELMVGQARAELGIVAEV